VPLSAFRKNLRNIRIIHVNALRLYFVTGWLNFCLAAFAGWVNWCRCQVARRKARLLKLLRDLLKPLSVRQVLNGWYIVNTGRWHNLRIFASKDDCSRSKGTVICSVSARLWPRTACQYNATKLPGANLANFAAVG
jgi:hypothetical protein